MCNGSRPNPAIGAERAFGRRARRSESAQTPDAARRILTAALAGLAIVTVDGSRLAGDSATTTSAAGSPTTTNPLLSQLRPVSRLNPNRIFVFNRDIQDQHVCACDFSVWTASNGYREADAVRARVVARYSTMHSGKIPEGDVFLYVGTVEEPYFVVYDPDAHVADSSSTARGVWQVSASDLRSTATAPRSTPS